MGGSCTSKGDDDVDIICEDVVASCGSKDCDVMGEGGAVDSFYNVTLYRNADVLTRSVIV